MIGLVIIVVPAVMGVGYEHVDRALNGGMVLQTLVLLCALKLVATIVSYSSGNAGGIFAPSLYIGAMAGGAIGSSSTAWRPSRRLNLAPTRWSAWARCSPASSARR